jgi:hypothetical protein
MYNETAVKSSIYVGFAVFSYAGRIVCGSCNINSSPYCCREECEKYEKNVSAQKAAKKQRARLQKKNVHQKRQKSSRQKKSEG